MASSSVSKQAIGAYQLNERNSKDSPLIMDIRVECRRLCGWDRETFPGAQPVSLTKKNLPQVARTPYVVCEKSDGERHMLMVYKGLVYIIDRMFNIYRVNLSLPNLEKTSLLDGELIVDTTSVGKQTTVRYLVYDAVHLLGRSVSHESLLHRLRGAFIELIRPRTARKDDSFAIYCKDFFDVCHSAAVVFPLGCRLPHLCDGLIFTPVDDAYKGGTCQRLLKWKPAHMNTVDFVLDLVMGFEKEHVHAKLLVAEAGVQKFKNNWLARTGEMWNWLVENRKEVNGKIAECGWDPNAYTFIPTNKKDFVESGMWMEGGGWVLHRIRDDRTIPNDESVVEKVKMSIQDGISIEQLHDTLKNVTPLRIPHAKRRINSGSVADHKTQRNQ